MHNRLPMDLPSVTCDASRGAKLWHAELRFARAVPFAAVSLKCLILLASGWARREYATGARVSLIARVIKLTDAVTSKQRAHAPRLT